MQWCTSWAFFGFVPVPCCHVSSLSELLETGCHVSRSCSCHKVCLLFKANRPFVWICLLLYKIVSKDYFVWYSWPAGLLLLFIDLLYWLILILGLTFCLFTFVCLALFYIFFLLFNTICTCPLLNKSDNFLWKFKFSSLEQISVY